VCSSDLWAKSGSTILPGAIAEHLTSCGGMMGQAAGQTPCTEFLRHGAGGSSGAVAEPYNYPMKFPSAFIHVHYARGASLAEAFYQSVSGPYQLLIVGDPLCQPWAKKPRPKFENVADGQKIKGAVSLRPTAEAAPGMRVGRYELFVDGVLKEGLDVSPESAEVKAPVEFALDTATMADGWHELRLAAVNADEIASRDSCSLLVEVDNQGKAVETICSVEQEIAWDRDVWLEVACPGAKLIRIKQGDSMLTSIKGDQGTVKIPAAEIGVGEVTLYAEARLEDGGDVIGKPVKFAVIPPAPAEAQVLPVVPADGISLSVKDGGNFYASKFDRNLLRKAGLKPGQEFTVRTFWQVPADGLCQLRLSGNVRQIGWPTLDGQPLHWPGGGKEKMIPLNLLTGMHEFVYKAVMTPGGFLDLRAGPGYVRTLDSGSFSHLAQENEVWLDKPEEKPDEKKAAETKK